MREHPLKSLLSRVLRGSEDASDFELVYRHRGAPGDEMRIFVSSIVRLGKGWFLLSDEETQIPFHRVLLVRNLKSGQVLWESRSRSSAAIPDQ